MNDVRQKLTNCFRTVFPDLPEASIPTASSATIAAWDSVAAITLLQVVEEEFQREVDLERIGELSSFEALVQYLSSSSPA
jgi:acyl carrier protein